MKEMVDPPEALRERFRQTMRSTASLAGQGAKAGSGTAGSLPKLALNEDEGEMMLFLSVLSVLSGCVFGHRGQPLRGIP